MPATTVTMSQGCGAQYELALLKSLTNKGLSMARQIVIVLLSIGVISGAGGLSGCSRSSTRDSEKGKHMPARTIEEVLKDKTDEWMALPGVVGTAIGMSEGSHCIKILSSVNAQELRTKIPSSVEGYSVMIEETGEFRALDKE